MEYTIQKLAQMAGVSTRTLRYYDEISLLKPLRINSSGYRIYGGGEVDMLQQILFYRELGVGLDDIKEIISSPKFEDSKALEEHHKKLLEKREQLNLLITNVEKTIKMKQGGIKMADKEKFEGFKQKMIDENEKEFGKEIREKYGNDQVDKSNKKLKNMSEGQYKEIEELGNNILETLSEAIKTGDPASELAQKMADMHKKWLTFYWDNYSKDAHRGVAQMYVDDERFTAYYDKAVPGGAKFLRDAIMIYTGKSK